MNFQRKKILLTYGPTWVPIDGSRILTNLSSGQLGGLLANRLQRLGAQVTAIEGPVAKPIKNGDIHVIKFRYYDELSSALKKTLKQKFDVIIHAAAVSDYQLSKTYDEKISSRLPKLTLELIPTEKLILMIKRKQPQSYLVGFKLITKLSHMTAKKTAKDLFEKARCDLVVANSSHDDDYSGFILNPEGDFLGQETSRAAITKTLIRIIHSDLFG